MKKVFHVYLASYKGLSKPTWMLAVVMLVNRTGAMVLPFLSIYLTSVLGFDLKHAGIILSFYGLGSVTGSVAGGWLTDKLGHFKVQVASLFLAVPVFILLSYLKDMAILSAGIYLLSTITEIFRPANSVSINTYETRENITRAFSLNRMALNLGFSVGPALGGFLAMVSYKLLFYGNGFTSALAGLVFYLFFQKVHKRKKLSQDRKNSALPITKSGSPWRDKYFLIFCVVCCAYSLGFFQLLNALPIYYKEVCGLNNFNIGLLLGFNGFVVFFLEMLLVSYAEGRYSFDSVIFIGTLICAVSFLILLLGKGMLILYLGIFLLSVSEIFAMPFIATVAIQSATRGREGSYMGINGLAFSVAFILSPILSTFIAARSGYQSLWIATTVFLIGVAFGFRWVCRKLKRR